MADDNPNRPSKVQFTKEPESHFSGFFKIDEYEVSYEKFSGAMSPPQKLLVFDRGHAVAALLYDPILRQVIFVDQFRLPTFHKTKGADHHGTGWIYECAAGMIKEGETPYKCLVREVEEETGYIIKKAIPIASYYSSPGGSTEMIHLYLAEVSSLDKKGPGNGVEDEDIEIIQVPVQRFFERLALREFADSKLILAGYFLKDHLAASKNMIRQDRAPPTLYRLKGSKDLHIGIRPGDMLVWRDIDVWVNSENTDMEMNHFHGRGVSTTIRYGGALKHPGTSKVKEDTIADAVKAARGRHGYVAPATVIETTSGELERTHNVKRIFHVAVVEGFFGEGLKFEHDVLERSVDNVLTAIDRANDKLDEDKAYKSVLIPMMGTGNAGARLTDVAPKIIDRAVAYLESKMKREAAGGRIGGALRTIHLSAFDDSTDMLLRRILEVDSRLQRPDDPSAM